MQGDYVVPGSPLDDYITLLDEQGLLDSDEKQNDQLVENEVPEPVYLWPLLKNILRSVKREFFHFHRDQLNGHLKRINDDIIEHRQRHLDATLSFLVESDLAQLEQELFIARHNTRVKGHASVRLELGLLAPIFTAHFIYLVFVEPQSFSLCGHLFLFLAVGYFILLHIRSELITWRCRADQFQLINHAESCCMLFKKADRLISQSLRLVRDITVIATGHTTVNTTRIVKTHSSALELRQAVIDMTRAIIGQFGQFETDDNFEVELLTYQEQRSAYLAKMANVGELVDDSILDLVNTEMVNLEAKLESTRRCSQRVETTKQKANFDKTNLSSLYRSLSLHAKALTESAYQAELGDDIDQAILESHACSVVQTMQLIIDFGKMSSTKEQSVQVSKESGVPIETQTSLPVESIDRPDIRDDEVLECITTQNDQPLESELVDDEVDEATKQASSVVFTELKSILHLEVNPEKRQKRKQELFPGFWEKEQPKPVRDEIIPDNVSLFDLDSETDKKAVTFESGEDHNRPLIFADELETRRTTSSNHDYCCPSDEQFSIAQMVAQRAKKNQATEFLYGSDSE